MLSTLTKNPKVKDTKTIEEEELRAKFPKWRDDAISMVVNAAVGDKYRARIMNYTSCPKCQHEFGEHGYCCGELCCDTVPGRAVQVK